MSQVGNGRQVERLVLDLVDALEDDWVSIPSMTTLAADVSGTWDRRTNRALICAALLALTGRDDVKVVDADMGHEFTSRDELARHLDREWPDNGQPIESEIGWLVERDFELRQREAGPD